MAEKLRIVFMGTPAFAVPAFEALAAAHEIVAVYTQPPRPKGRGQHVQLSPVHEAAKTRGIDVFHPASLKKSPEAVGQFRALKADVAVVAAYGLILPPGVLDAPRFGCLNIHASLLPRWRGASPIQHAIWKGDAQSGVCIMQMEEGLDTGPVISREAIVLDPAMTAPLLHDALAALGARMIKDAAGRLAREQEKLPATAQPAEGATYAPLLKKEDGRIDWNKTAIEIDRQIRALNPWPGVYGFLPGGARLKILAAAPGAGAVTGKPGTLTDAQGHVVCGDGTVLQLLQVQPDNARPMDIKAALNGRALAPGMVLE